MSTEQKESNTQIDPNGTNIHDMNIIRAINHVYDNDLDSNGDTIEYSTDEEYDIEYDSEDSEDRDECVYFKYYFENCECIDDILCRIEGLKQEFEKYKENGYELCRPVDTGYCFLNNTNIQPDVRVDNTEI